MKAPEDIEKSLKIKYEISRMSEYKAFQIYGCGYLSVTAIFVLRHNQKKFRRMSDNHTIVFFISILSSAVRCSLHYRISRD